MNKLLNFARSVLTSECYTAVVKLQDEIRKLKVDPNLFTVVVGVIPREQKEEFDVGTASFARGESVYVVSGDSYDSTNPTISATLTENELLEIIENELLNLSEFTDSSLLRIQTARDEVKDQPKPENTN